MRKKLVLTIRYPLVWLLLLSGCMGMVMVWPALGGTASSVLLPYTKTVLANGLTVVVKEVHTTPLVAVDIWVRAGACNEVAAEAGISHFMEHMLFKGTKKRAVGEITRAIQSVGGYSNAATSLDYTHYYVVVPSDQLALALEVETDAIRNSAFDPKEITRERQVILEEMRLKQDDPGRRLGWLAYRQIFKGTPYAQDVLGAPESLAGVSRETFLNYQRQYYLPNNMVMAVVGDVDTVKVIGRITELMGDFKSGKLPEVPRVTLPKLEQVVRVAEKMPVDQNYFYLGFPGPGLRGADTPALTVLSVILGGGQGSRLYQELREKRQLVNTVATGYQTYQQVGMLAVYAEAKQLTSAEFETQIIKMINNVAAEGVTTAELNRAKAMIHSQWAMAAETNAEIAALIGEYEIGGSFEDAVQFEAALQRVNREDVLRVAKRYLTSRAYVAVTVQPEGEKRHEK
ncbi:MAG: pitrilysin family protein [Bacillota bacterium]